MWYQLFNKQISFLAQRFGFAVIEDASHAVGARYQGEFVGSSTYSQICVFSFHPVKIITSAEGYGYNERSTIGTTYDRFA